MVERWTEWAAGVVETWPDDIAAAEPDRDVLVAQAERSEAWHARQAAGDDG